MGVGCRGRQSPCPLVEKLPTSKRSHKGRRTMPRWRLETIGPAVLAPRRTKETFGVHLERGRLANLETAQSGPGAPSQVAISKQVSGAASDSMGSALASGDTSSNAQRLDNLPRGFGLQARAHVMAVQLGPTTEPLGVPLCPQARLLVKHGRDRDWRAAQSMPGSAHRQQGMPRIRNRCLGAPAQYFQSPHKMDVHNR
jgi:hypothetical protein